MVVFLAAAGFLAALFFLAAALGFLAAVFFLAMVFLTGDFFCGARQGAGQPSVRAHCTGSGGTPSLRASNCDRDSAVRRTGRRRAVGESYTGAAFAPRHPPPRAPERLLAAMGLGGSAWWAGAWWAGAWWAGASWAGAHLGLGRELEGRLDLDEHALGDAELERVLERQVVLRMEARARRVSSLRVVLFAAAARRWDPWGGREVYEEEGGARRRGMRGNPGTGCR